MYNKQFNLGIDDIELIEDALRAYAHNHEELALEVHLLLGLLHNQKQWYRPEGHISG